MNHESKLDKYPHSARNYGVQKKVWAYTLDSPLEETNQGRETNIGCDWSPPPALPLSLREVKSTHDNLNAHSWSSNPRDQTGTGDRQLVAIDRSLALLLSFQEIKPSHDILDGHEAYYMVLQPDIGWLGVTCGLIFSEESLGKWTPSDWVFNIALFARLCRMLLLNFGIRLRGTSVLWQHRQRSKQNLKKWRRCSLLRTNHPSCS
jgi:hypothetical protein